MRTVDVTRAGGGRRFCQLADGPGGHRAEGGDKPEWCHLGRSLEEWIHGDGVLAGEGRGSA